MWLVKLCYNVETINKGTSSKVIFAKYNTILVEDDKFVVYVF